MRTFLETLKLYNNLKSQLKHCQLHIRELEELAGFSPSHGTEGAPGASSPSNVVEHITIKIIELESERQDLEYTIEGLRADMCRCMDRNLDEKSKEVVELRVFVRRSWEHIAKTICYSMSHARRIYGDAIKKLQNSNMYELYEEDINGRDIDNSDCI